MSLGALPSLLPRVLSQRSVSAAAGSDYQQDIDYRSPLKVKPRSFLLLLEQLFLEQAQVRDKTLVGLDNASLLPHQIPGLLVAYFAFPHQKGNHHGGTPRFAYHAVHQHVLLLQLLPDIFRAFSQQRQNAQLREVVDLEPAVVGHSSGLDLPGDLAAVVGLGVDDADHTVDGQLVLELGVPQHCHPSQIKVAAMRGLPYPEDVGAVPDCLSFHIGLSQRIMNEWQDQAWTGWGWALRFPSNLRRCFWNPSLGSMMARLLLTRALACRKDMENSFMRKAMTRDELREMPI